MMLSWLCGRELGVWSGDLLLGLVGHVLVGHVLVGLRFGGASGPLASECHFRTVKGSDPVGFEMWYFRSQCNG